MDKKQPRLRLMLTPFRILAILGPGVIAASAGNDAGAIATHSLNGALFGYNMLWAIILISLSLFLVQEMSGRLGAITGKGFSDLVRERFDLRLTVFAMLALFISNAGTTISEFAGIAASLELFGISRFISVPLAALVVWFLIVKGTYQHVEKLFLAMSAIFLSYVFAAFYAQPDWLRVGKSIIAPTITLDSSYITLLVATVGTTITPYMQVYQQSAIVERGVTASQYKFARVDTLVGVIFATLIVIFIQIATGATLHPAGIKIETAADAAQALSPLVGKYATDLFGIGLFGASMLAAGVLPLATAFSITEAFGWESGVNLSFKRAPIFYTIFTFLIVISTIIILLPNIPLIQLLITVQIINGLLLPIEIMFMLKLANDRDLMGKYVNGKIFNFLARVTLVGLVLIITLYFALLAGIPVFSFFS